MSRWEDIKGLFRFIKERNKWWLMPYLVILLCLGLVIIFAESSALAPLIYTLF